MGSTSSAYQYAGEQYDSDLGIYYNRARYYNQRVGRFSQMDSYLGRESDPITLNKYLYANGNPVMYTDPSGNFALGESGAALQIMGILAASALTISYQAGQELAGNNPIGIGYTPVQLGWLSIAAVSSKMSQVRVQAEERLKKRKDNGKITLSRAVGDNELASIYSCKCYSFGYGGYELGKQFWINQSSAIAFGYQFILRDKNVFHVTNATISMNLYNSIPPDFVHKNLDNLGDAVTVPADMLPIFNLEANVNGGIKYVGTYWK